MLTIAQAAKAFWNAYNAHDLEALLSLVDDQVVVRFPLSPEPVVGRRDMSAIWSLIFHQLVPDIQQDVATSVIRERSAAFELIERGTVRLPGACLADLQPQPRRYENRIAVFLSVNESGWIERVDFYWDTAAFARQLGLNAEALGDFHAQATNLRQWIDRATSPDGSPPSPEQRKPELQTVA